MKIKLTRGKYALVDDEDFEYLNQFKWHCTYYGYAARRDENKKMVQMHRVIMETPEGFDTDHISMDKLDNRKCNLRIATRSQNNANRKMRDSNTSGYKGISWDKNKNKWFACIRKNGKTIYIGRYLNIKDAVIAYENKAREIFGEFARTN